MPSAAFSLNRRIRRRLTAQCLLGDQVVKRVHGVVKTQIQNAVSSHRGYSWHEERVANCEHVAGVDHLVAAGGSGIPCFQTSKRFGPCFPCQSANALPEHEHFKSGSGM